MKNKGLIIFLIVLLVCVCIGLTILFIKLLNNDFSFAKLSFSSESKSLVLDKTYELTGRTPSYCEIAEEFSVTSACVCKYIKEMANRNMLTIQAGFRGIVTEKMKQTVNTINIPVVGSIACGSPLLAQENIETYLPISKDFLGNGNFFILIAKGDSMIDANINDGDYVIVRQQESAEQGQIVVALINDEATLKRYYLDKRKKKVR